MPNFISRVTKLQVKQSCVLCKKASTNQYLEIEQNKLMKYENKGYEPNLQLPNHQD